MSVNVTQKEKLGSNKRMPETVEMIHPKKGAPNCGK